MKTVDPQAVAVTAHPETERRWPRAGVWLAVLVVSLFEFVIFDQFGSRRHTGVYPRWNDQIQYLADGYTAYERARGQGFLPALGHTFVNPSAQGTLHDVAALLVFQLAGPSRSAALALNQLAFIAWQVALFLAVWRLTRHLGLASLAGLLPLALAGPWENVPGSAYDFRLDHLAMCLLGITSAAAILSDGFRRRDGALLFGLTAAVTLLTRFLTGTYFVLIFAALAAWILTGPDRRERFKNLALAAALAFVLAAPFFWLNREAVFNYYWIGHYVGPESAIRNQNLGLARSVDFVARVLAGRHLGWYFAAIAGAGLLAFALTRGARALSSAGRCLGITGTVFLLGPALVLILHQQKSDVVLSALAPGVVLLVVGGWTALVRITSPRHFTVAATVLGAAALGFFVQRQLRPAYDPATLAHIRQVNTIADTLAARVRAAQLAPAWVGVDYITDCLDAQILRVLCYERQGAWLPFDMSLPTGIAEPQTADVQARLEKSHFMFVTEDAPVGGFPYDRKLADMRPAIRTWCETHLVLVHRFELLGRRMALYQRPEIPLLPPRP